MQHKIVWASALLMGITFARGYASHEFPMAELTTTPAAPSQNRITVPAGTRILVRTADAFDSGNQREGQRFTATLETNLKAEGTVVVRRGATVHGRFAEARSAGRRRGSSQLTLELTDIVINGTAYPIVTNPYDLTGRAEGARTAQRVVRGTGLGAVVGGVSGGGRGAGTGALVGAGAGSVASRGRGEQVVIPRDSLLEFRLGHPVALPIGR